MGLRSQDFQKIGETDVSRLRAAIADFGAERWREDQWRQSTFEAHKATQTLPIIFDRDFRHINPTFHPLFFEMQEALRDCFASIRRFFPGDGYVIRCILAKLRAHSEITAHRDTGDSLLAANRIHIPITTNENVVFTIGDTVQRLRPGEVWMINNGNLHAVKNDSDEDRVHLIVDWVDFETSVSAVIAPMFDAAREMQQVDQVAGDTAFVQSVERCLSLYGDMRVDAFGMEQIRDVLDAHDFGGVSESERARALWNERWNTRDQVPSPDKGFIFDVNPLVKKVAESGAHIGKTLEVGCGPGAHSLYLGGKGIESIGVDLCEPAIAAAREAASKRECNSTFVDGDFFDQDFAENSFDLVVDVNCLQTIPFYRVNEYVARLHSLMAPNGKLVLVCPSADHKIGHHSHQLVYTNIARLIMHLYSGYTETEFTRSELLNLYFGDFNVLGMHMMRNEAVGAFWHAMLLQKPAE